MTLTKRKVRIALESRQEDEVTRHAYAGEWVLRGRSAFLHYEEEEDGGRVRTVMRWGEDEIKITRRGDVETEQTFVPNARRGGSYRMGGLSFPMETVTDAIAFRDPQAQGEGARRDSMALPLTIEWSYSLWMEDQQIGRFEIRLDIWEDDRQ
ncbi:DUF1934 domain-containing protein [Paenibacillus sp. IB182496]|uniref:DUF1934 domain-containing protein n=1 Tax=Paenibacillus sabuli TaxID=2772509 RepID=A0A927BRT6_9BACL|nr:DUF1934 domain-containing protein [Paenibacillus sabuli]MBD2845592.1 DUF1934 domain-containing protein [Paenibacillus sabuli]